MIESFFSSAFRSLQDKTQVIPLSKTDFVHTRLTHSLESVVGRSLGRLVEKNYRKIPAFKRGHGYHMNDFGQLWLQHHCARYWESAFGHWVKTIGEYFR
jgi:dGTPase